MFNEENLEIEDFAEEVIEETIEQPFGIVIDCKKLNVRVEPNLSAEVVCEIPKNGRLLVDLSASTSEWYKVYTENGLEGFCMKKYITVEWL